MIFVRQIFFLKFLEDINPFCGASGAPALDFSYVHT